MVPASPGQPYTSGAALAAELESKINADATLVAAAGRQVAVVFDQYDQSIGAAVKFCWWNEFS